MVDGHMNSSTKETESGTGGGQGGGGQGGGIP